MKLSRLLFSFSILALLFAIQCSVSPGRKILVKGSVEPDISIGMFLSGAPYAASPVVPNLDLGLRYGLTDRITIGGSWSPIPIFTKEVIFVKNPFLAGQVLPPYKMLPSVNMYLAVPFFIPLRLGEFKAVPLVGVVIRKEWGQFGMYPIVESAFDSDVFENKINVHTNARLGIDWTTLNKTAFTLELGMDNIGYRNFLGNLTYGIPCIHISISHSFIKKQSD